MTLVSTAARGSGSGTSDCVLIGSQVLSADGASLAVASIPATYRAMKIAALVRTTRASTSDVAFLRFNDDTTVGNYFTGQYQNNAGTNTTVQTTGVAGISLPCSAASNSAGAFAGWDVWVQGYDSASYSTVLTAQGYFQPASGVLQYTSAGEWSPTTIVTKVSLVPSIGPNFLAGSRLMVYGLT